MKESRKCYIYINSNNNVTKFITNNIKIINIIKTLSKIALQVELDAKIQTRKYLICNLEIGFSQQINKLLR